MIEIQNVCKKFGNVDAVRDITFRIEAGEFVTLLGPSGCGKTTVLRMIAGFEAPTSGRILLEGTDVTSLPPYRRDVNQVFQSYALFPHLSVQDNVGFGLRMKHVPRDEARSRIAEAIEMVQLKGMEHRRPNQLSGGQQQRVALARALVCRPKVLLLDEPMAALDAALRRNMQVELKNLQQRLGITFLFVTHDQGEALLLSDRIAVMNGGAVEQFDTAVQVYTKPATPFVARFIGQANVMEASAISSDGSTTRLRTNGGTELTAAGLHRGEVCLAIRSESIRIQDSPINGANVLHAKVQQVLFGGATAQYSLQTDGGMLLTASAPPSAIRAGDTVWCEIDPQSILVLSG